MLGFINTVGHGGEVGFTAEHLCAENFDKTLKFTFRPYDKPCNHYKWLYIGNHKQLRSGLHTLRVNQIKVERGKYSLSLLTWKAAIVVGKSFDELLSSLLYVVEEHWAQSLDIQSGVSLYLQLAQIILDNRTTVLEKQVASLESRTRTLTYRTNCTPSNRIPKSDGLRLLIQP